MKSLILPGLALLLAHVPAVRAQTTDGYHSAQILPVVVDSASFTQRIDLSTPNTAPVTVHTRFLPGSGSSQAAVGPLACNDVLVPADGGVVVPSLRSLCPGLVAGSAFGMLTLDAAASSDGMYSDIPLFAAYSRVSNPQGNGFSVEAFAAHVFTSASTRITGLRRLAATADAPSFQSNCFVGQMPRLSLGPSLIKRVTYVLSSHGATWAGFVDVGPGKLVRLLDVFAAAGAPAGDHDDASIEFTPANDGTQGVVAYCTVQDNTSFGADFRIAKTSAGNQGLASQDGTAAREMARKADGLGRAFEIGPGSSANTHVVYFRHPDTVQCELLSPLTGSVLGPSSGLEMVLYGADLEEHGGNLQTGTGIFSLGDKHTHAGYNNRYFIEVESNETNAGATRAYVLYCASGSGNTFGYDIVRYQEPIDRF